MVLNEWYSYLIPKDMTGAVPSHVIKIWVYGNPSTFTLTGLQVLPRISPPLLCSLSTLCCASPVIISWPFASCSSQCWWSLLNLVLREHCWSGMAVVAGVAGCTSSPVLHRACCPPTHVLCLPPAAATEAQAALTLHEAGTFFLRLHNAFLKSCWLGNSGTWKTLKLY